MSAIYKLEKSLLHALSFLSPQERAGFKRTSKGTHLAVQLFDFRYAVWKSRVLFIFQTLAAQFKGLLDDDMRAQLKEHAEGLPRVFDPLTFYSAYAPAQHIAYVSEELQNEGYTNYEKQLVLRSLIAMTTPFPRAGTKTPPPPELADFADGIAGKGEIRALFINKIAVLHQNGIPVAKVMFPCKDAENKFEVAHKLENEHRRYYIQDLNKIDAVFQIARALGIRLVPPTHRLADGTILQYMLKKCFNIEKLLSIHPASGKILGDIDKTELDLQSLLRLFIGDFDLHTENTMVSADENRRYHLYDIDSELAFNTRFVKRNQFAKEEAQLCEGGGQTVSWPMGLPQASRVVSKAVTKLFCGWSGWTDKCVTVLKSCELQKAGKGSNLIDAFQERCLRIQALSTRPFSVRLAYHTLHGGEFSYELERAKGTPPLAFFVRHMRVEAYDKFMPETLYDESCVALGNLETHVQPAFPIEKVGYKSPPGEELFAGLTKNGLWKFKKNPVYKIPKGAFDKTRYAELLKRYPHATNGFRTFLLSLCLEGTAKRYARHFAEPGTLFAELVVEVAEKDGAEWLTMHSHPILLEFGTHISQGQKQYQSFKVMELTGADFSVSKFEAYKKGSHKKSYCCYGEPEYLSGKMKIFIKAINELWENRFLTVEQEGDRHYLVFEGTI